jgi:hypothetical protein
MLHRTPERNEVSDIAQDLDETRRLLYMGMCVGDVDEWELAGTLINALLHHEGAEPGLTAAEAKTHISALFAGEPTARLWAEDSIERISLQLRNLANHEQELDETRRRLDEHLSGPIAD